jgi:hypothetical protein
MPPAKKKTPEQKLRQIKTIVKRTRSREELLRAEASSRSTGIRNVYRESHDALAAIEAVLNGKP